MDINELIKRKQECERLSKEGFKFEQYDFWAGKDDLRTSWYYVRREIKLTIRGILNNHNYYPFEHHIKNLKTAIKYFVMNLKKVI